MAKRIVYGALFLGFLALSIVAALPAHVSGRWGSAVQGALRKVSLSQVWGMYAPDPQRSQAYLHLRAEYEDGRSEVLEEGRQAMDGWGTQWAWTKRREDIWRQNVGFFKERDRDLTWYLRMVCVREARRGEVPLRLVAERVRRRLLPPEAVARGEGDFGPIEREPLRTMDCRALYVRGMIQGDPQAGS